MITSCKKCGHVHKTDLFSGIVALIGLSIGLFIMIRISIFVPPEKNALVFGLPQEIWAIFIGLISFLYGVYGAKHLDSKDI